jgi:sortase B
MQTVNNDYYLDHDFNGKEDKNGSIFLDCNCNAMFRSTNLIIYGHHMKSGKMFGNLKKYESEDYCKEHNIIQFDTIYEKGLYEVMYVFRDNIKDAEDVSFKYYQFIDAASPEEFESNMNAMSEMSLYDTGVTATYGDDILTLSTCNGSTSTARFVVVAKRIPSSEVTYVYEKK